MSYTVAILVVLLSSFAAGLVTMLVQRRVRLDLRRHHHDVGSVVFLQLGVVFAVLLAFVFSEVWEEYKEAARAIDLEVGALHGAAMEASTLPQPEADEILSAERAYIEAVAFQEWPTMARTRGEDDQADMRLQDLITDAARLRFADPDQNETKARIRELLAEAHTQRETRIFQADSGIPVALWVVLISFSAVLVLSVSFSGIEYWTTSATVAAGFAAAIVSILVIARLLDYPFEGGLALSSRDYIGVLDKISNLLSG